MSEIRVKNPTMYKLQSMTKNKTILSIVISFFAFFVFSINDMLSKIITNDNVVPWLSFDNVMQPLQLLFLTTASTLVCYVSIAKIRGGLHVLKIRRASITIIVTRTLVNLCNSFIVILSFRSFPMVQVYAMIFATPIVITVLSVLILKEEVGWRRWSATVLGFIGVLIALNPSVEILKDPIQLLPLLIALFGGLNIIIAKKAMQRERSIAIIFWNSLITLFILLAPTVIFWQTISFLQIVIALFAGFLVATAAFSIMIANNNMPASSIAPIQYSQFVWGALIDWQVFKNPPPGANTYFGVFVIILSSFYTMIRMNKIKRQRRWVRVKKFINKKSKQSKAK